MQPGRFSGAGVKGGIILDKIFYLYPADKQEYLRLLTKVGPELDNAGISFHICQPGEDIAGSILRTEEVSK